MMFALVPPRLCSASWHSTLSSCENAMVATPVSHSRSLHSTKDLCAVSSKYLNGMNSLESACRLKPTQLDAQKSFSPVVLQPSASRAQSAPMHVVLRQ
jgi:hypothetical protein